MQNVQFQREGDLLIVKIDLSKDYGPSASGKTVIVASTRGNARIPGEDEAYIGINAFRRNGRRARSGDANASPQA
jgi:hypothetical protein